MSRAREIARFEGFQVDFRSGELRPEGGPTIQVPEQSFRILATLVERQGEVITREELKNRLWPNNTLVEFEHSINAAINRLRQLLGDSADSPKFIETLPRRGYRWKPPVEWAASTSMGATSSSQLTELAAGGLIGKKISRYRVLELLGAGGMGVVFKAEDVTLGRKVALKFLPEESSSDPSALERFSVEARAASALDHPGICTIYDFGEYGHHPFMVMQLLQGQTIRDRLETETPIPWDELIKAAVQVADALEATHQIGIIHRDIKPANVFLTSRGEAKVLDFGLAKLSARDHVPNFGNPTLSKISQPPSAVVSGIGMGTASYMSPEQVRGEKLDPRTDLFSLGLVMYEMATAQRAFSGDTVAEVQDAILHQKPRPVSSLNPDVPLPLERVIFRALEKDRHSRYQCAAELASELRKVQSEAKAKKSSVMNKAAKRYRWSAFAVLLLSASLTSAAWWRSRRPPLPPMSIIPITSYRGDLGFPALSPDGNQLAFLWDGGGSGSGLYVKLIGEDTPVRVSSSDHGGEIDGGPVWSPDGHRLAFVRCNGTSGHIVTVPASGGVERVLADLRFCSGGLDWSSDGKLLVFTDKDSMSEPKGLFLLSLEGGNRQRLTRPPQPGFDFQPRFSPDGQTLAFVRARSVVIQDVYLIKVGGGEPRRLTFTENYIMGLTWTRDSEEVIFTNQVGEDNSLWRIVAKGGVPQRVAEVAAVNAREPVAARQANRLVYTQSSSHANIWELRLRTTGERPWQRREIISSTRWQDGARLSPDETKFVFVSDRSGSPQLWICARDGSSPRQLTFLKGEHTGTPDWSPDGRFIVFSSASSTSSGIYRISVNGGTPDGVIVDGHVNGAPSFSRDGRWIYFVSDRTGDYQIWRVGPDGNTPVQVTAHGGWFPTESFDGLFLYYVKSPFPASKSTVGELWRMATASGEEARVFDQPIPALDWTVAPDGVYFLDPETKPHPTLKLVHPQTGQITTLAVMDHLLSCCDQQLAISKDGHHVFYTEQDGDTSDVMLIENFR